MLTTSFQRLREHHACKPRYRHLAKALGGIRAYGQTTPIPLSVILEKNGLDDALWAFPTVPDDQRDEMQRISRIFACRCVRETPLQDGRKVWDLLTDERSRGAVEVAERYAAGESSDDELAAAWDAARDAARDAAGDAAWAAAWDAAGAAAGAAARAAAWDAAGAAAWAAARAAAWDAEAEILRSLLTGDVITSSGEYALAGGEDG